ncbi:BrnT family toxin [Candidatus Oscillochloris fontis]|uniref:BrnT family toxin n=1 Tax=Candidatus Oscillochloris fontis TaxID=2496868 RepID=UPI00101C22DE|nr:BrnT family toxin [Candidatus Oscillochloris fontis]
MSNTRFEYDEEKALKNIAKHGMSFEEAITVFSDDFSITIYDEIHSIDEDRYIDIGRSIHNRLLVVVYTERRNRIRIISPRQATTVERKSYEQRDA